MPRHYRRKRRRNRRPRRSIFARGLQRTPASTYYPDSVRAFPYEDYYEERERHPRHGKGAPALKKQDSIATQHLLKGVPTATQNAITAEYTKTDYWTAGAEFLKNQGVAVTRSMAGHATNQAIIQTGAGILSGNPYEFATGVAALTALAGQEAIPYIQRGASVFLAARQALPTPNPQASATQNAINALSNIAMAGYNAYMGPTTYGIAQDMPQGQGALLGLTNDPNAGNRPGVPFP